MSPLPPTDLLVELEPVVAENLDRHLETAKDWMPHEYVPWSQGRDFDVEAWAPDQSKLSPVARTAMEVNLLTEDNLPSYHREIDARFGREGAWGTWVNRWTAEEGRHAIVMRDYLVVTRGVDPDELERGRMQQMQQGYDSGGKNLLQAMAYVTFQELATRISHRNTGRFTEDPIAEKLLARVAQDENLHMVFYRNLVKAAYDVAPDETMAAVAEEVIGFVMPGAGITGFARKAAQIAKAGIYDLRIHHDDVVQPVLRHWNVLEMTGLGAAGEAARERLAGFVSELDANAARFEQQRAEAAAKTAAGRAAATVA